jgi:hypothetical protein
MQLKISNYLNRHNLTFMKIELKKKSQGIVPGFYTKKLMNRAAKK